LSIRAVIFDYGMVLTGQPVQEAHEGMVRITELPVDEFEKFYWADRHAYDEGKLSGTTFWQKFKADSGLPLTEEQLEELNRLDAKMWTTSDPRMLAWHDQLRQRGIRTAILSNMGDSVLENIEREFAWIHGFDALVWSFQLGMAKPAPDIYRHALEKLETRPGETLFLDDKQVNIDAARELGIEGLLFNGIDQLRRDLVARGFDRDLPLPAVGCEDSR
jgi:putative hydrolase of the HAD superfamily